MRELRQRRFDLIIDLQGLFRSGFLAAAAGAKHRIGPREAREFAWVFYNHRIPRGDPNVHAAARNYAVADMLGFADGPLDFSIALTDEDRQEAASLLAQADLPANGPYVVLVPATRWETKCWSTERYGQLADTIRKKHGLASILVGGASDIGAGQTSVDASNGAAHNLCGKTTLRQLAALIDRAALVVTADSTPMHIAAAHHRPLVAIFGPTNPNRTGPYGRADDVLRLELDCSPCYLRKISQCPHQHACMNDMTLETVARAVEERLASTKISV